MLNIPYLLQSAFYLQSAFCAVQFYSQSADYTDRYAIMLLTPFLRDGFGFIAVFETLCSFFRPTAISNCGDDTVSYV